MLLIIILEIKTVAGRGSGDGRREKMKMSKMVGREHRLRTDIDSSERRTPETEASSTPKMHLNESKFTTGDIKWL